jgi:acetoacetyl-CoA synthetase
MSKMLWQPSKQRIADAQITKFISFVNKRYKKNLHSYSDLYEWSVTAIPDFWDAVWRFTDIKVSRPYEKVVDDLSKFPGASWFPGAQLNYAENMLRFNNDHPAFIFIGETKKRTVITYTELYSAVARLASALREVGVSKGDRVVGYMPNMPETAIAMLAATSIGATWASCATDIGPDAALDRFNQIEPKVLFGVNGYYYKGKGFSSLKNLAQLAKGMPYLKKVVIASYLDEKPEIGSIPDSILWNEFVSNHKTNTIDFEQVPADHPLIVMFSSGTTGKPKCMVQSVGGILVNHLKELIIHSDLTSNDIIFYITTCSWMMWNWMLSSLATGATIILYDGNPLYPDVNAMWKLIQDEKITFFGCSASYINTLRSENSYPGKDFNLSSLSKISQTGSPLSAEGFDYVYKEIKKDVHFNSIAGGTDINGCFCIGNPIIPVYAGELQAPGLGMKISVYDENGNQVYDKEGELVCEAPAPPMPLRFWNDPENKKYHETYFNFYPDKNVWRHGDFVVRYRKTGGYTFYGRSDSVLKPSGVRIGTAEIYNQVEKIEGIADSLAIGQNWQGDQRLILFVKLASGYQLTDVLKNKIKTLLRDNASPRHVPSKILEVVDIPYTFNGKKVESSVTNIIHGRPVTNRDALLNPQSLDYFANVDELKI